MELPRDESWEVFAGIFSSLVWWSLICMDRIRKIIILELAVCRNCCPYKIIILHLSLSYLEKYKIKPEQFIDWIKNQSH
jgi:hypothetical protein